MIQPCHIVIPGETFGEPDYTFTCYGFSRQSDTYWVDITNADGKHLNVTGKERRDLLDKVLDAMYEILDERTKEL